MGVAEKGRRSGWEHQANGLVASHAALGTNNKTATKTATKTAVDQGGTLLEPSQA